MVLAGWTVTAVVGDARTALLEGLIDYAGLFPPARLDMASAVAEYRAARGGPHGWLLSRYLCPATRLEELAGVLTPSMTGGEAPWRLSVIMDGSIAESAAAGQAFDAEMDPAARIELAEARLPVASSDGRAGREVLPMVVPLLRAAASISSRVMPFLEIPVATSAASGIASAVLAIAGAAAAEGRPVGAKLRCGGLDAAMFPSSEQVAEFIVACVRHEVPIRATAGLHHPFRHFDADMDVMRHGFMNLLFATAIATSGASAAVVRAVVGDDDPAAFSVDTGRMAWHDHRVGTATIRRMRSNTFTGYGSCSFDEPVADLARLGLIGGATS